MEAFALQEMVQEKQEKHQGREPHGRIWVDWKKKRALQSSWYAATFSRRGWEISQERVAVDQAGDDRHLDQELRCILCEERPDPADVVEGKSAGLGHSGDVGGAGEFLADDHVLVPRSWWRRYCYVLDGDWQVHERAVFPWDEEEFSFMKVELEVMRWDACQTLWESHCNMGVGGWVKREEQFGVVCIAVKS